MNAATAVIVIQAQAVVAEMEGMKAENSNRERKGLVQAYAEKDFNNLASQLSGLANQLHEQRMNGFAE